MTLIWSIGKHPEGDMGRPGNEEGQKGGRGQGSGTQGSRVGREWRMAEGGIRGRKSSNIGEFAFPPSCHQFFTIKSLTVGEHGTGQEAGQRGCEGKC